MGISRSKAQKVGIILTVFSLFIAFQNCGQLETASFIEAENGGDGLRLAASGTGFSCGVPLIDPLKTKGLLLYQDCETHLVHATVASANSSDYLMFRGTVMTDKAWDKSKVTGNLLESDDILSIYNTTIAFELYVKGSGVDEFKFLPEPGSTLTVRLNNQGDTTLKVGPSLQVVAVPYEFVYEVGSPPPVVPDPGPTLSRNMEPNSYIDVTKGYGRTKAQYASGAEATKNTAAIQKAINDSYQQKKAVFFPSGTYFVNNTLKARTDDESGPNLFNNRVNQGFVLIGDPNNRPVIRLKNGSFNNSRVRPVFAFYNSPGAAAAKCDNGIDFTPGDCNRAGLAMNHILRNIVIDLGSNNKSAIGIRAWVAEGSQIQNVKITGSDYLAGFFSIPGSGGSMTNIEIENGDYGITGGARDGLALVSGLVLRNQKKAGIYTGDITGGTTGFIQLYEDDMRGSEYTTNSVPKEKVYQMSIEVVGFFMTNNDNSVPFIDNFTKGGNSHSKNIILIDGVLQYESPTTTNSMILHEDRNLYLSNVLTQNAKSIVKNYRSGGKEGSIVVNNSPNFKTEIKEFIHSDSRIWGAKSTKLINGSYVDNDIKDIVATNKAIPGPDPLQWVKKHDIGDTENSMPIGDLNDPEVVIVNPFAANGNFVNGSNYTCATNADSSSVIQQAINQARPSGVVFVPSGLYCLKKSITLYDSVKLLGSGAALTHLVANFSSGSYVPLLKTPSNENNSPWIFDLTVNYDAPKKIYALSWASGPGSRLFNFWAQSKLIGYSQNHNLRKIEAVGKGGGKWFNVISGQGGDTLSTSARNTYIGNSDAPVNGDEPYLELYMFHSQHVMLCPPKNGQTSCPSGYPSIGGYNSEFNQARNVSIYGLKSEQAHGGAWEYNFVSSSIKISNSRNIKVFGSGGAYSPAKNHGTIELIGNNNFNIVVANGGSKPQLSKKTSDPAYKNYFVMDNQLPNASKGLEALGKELTGKSQDNFGNYFEKK